jgi:hypothetical protein
MHMWSRDSGRVFRRVVDAKKLPERTPEKLPEQDAKKLPEQDAKKLPKAVQTCSSFSETQ